MVFKASVTFSTNTISLGTLTSICEFGSHSAVERKSEIKQGITVQYSMLGFRLSIDDLQWLWVWLSEILWNWISLIAQLFFLSFSQISWQHDFSFLLNCRCNTFTLDIHVNDMAATYRQDGSFRARERRWTTWSAGSFCGGIKLLRKERKTEKEKEKKKKQRKDKKTWSSVWTLPSKDLCTIFIKSTVNVELLQ